MNGWIKLHRKTFENPVCCKDSEHFFVWCWILVNAAYEEKRVLFDGKDTILKKGQLVTTLSEISNKLNINKSKVNRIIKNLKNEMQIETQSSAKNTLFTVLNWELYQDYETQNETLMKRLRNASETEVKRERNADGTPSYYIKKERIEEGEEGKKKKKASKEDNVQLLNRLLPDYQISDALSDKVREWVDYKISKKETYVEQGMKSLLKKISTQAQKNGDFAVMDLIDMSMENTWKGIIWDKLETKKTNNSQYSINWDNV